MILKNVEKKENNTALFTVESDAQEFEAAVNGAYLKNRRSINIPGFRKGKAPRAIVEGMYGPEVFYQDAMDDLAPVAFEKGLEEAELRIVGAPSIADVNVSEEKTVSYTFSVSLYPEVKLGQYKGLSAEKFAETVSDKEVEDEVERTRKQNARQVSIEDRPAQMGDTVNIDFDGYLNGERFDGGKAEGYSLGLGASSFVPGFEEQVAGMSLGEEKDIDITFPENYTPELAGKPVVFKIKLNGITFPELPELDDDFAQDVSEFDTLDEYKADVRAKLQKRYDDQAENSFRSLIMKQACDNMEADVPDVMIQEKAEEIVRNYASNFGISDRSIPMDKLSSMLGLDAETMTQNILPSAELQVRSDLLVEAIVKAEDIQCSDEQADEYVKRVASSVNASVEDIKKYFGEETIREEYKKEQAMNILFDSAVVKPAEEKAEEQAEEKAEAEAE